MKAYAAETAGQAADAVSHAFYEDPTFWVAVSFVILIAAVGKKVFRMAATGLDDRAESIRAKLEEAARLREEAQELLASNQRKQREAVEEAESIIKRAKEEAKRAKDRASKELEDAIVRREKQAEERIAQAEARAINDVRAQATEIALTAATEILAKAVTGKKAEALVNDAIEELPKHLN